MDNKTNHISKYHKEDIDNIGKICEIDIVKYPHYGHELRRLGKNNIFVIKKIFKVKDAVFYNVIHVENNGFGVLPKKIIKIKDNHDRFSKIPKVINLSGITQDGRTIRNKQEIDGNSNDNKLY